MLPRRSSDGTREGTGTSTEGVDRRLCCVAGDIISDMVFMDFASIIGVCDRLRMIMSLSVGSIINGGFCKLGRFTLSEKGSWDNDRWGNDCWENDCWEVDCWDNDCWEVDCWDNDCWEVDCWEDDCWDNDYWGNDCFVDDG